MLDYTVAGCYLPVQLGRYE